MIKARTTAGAAGRVGTTTPQGEGVIAQTQARASFQEEKEIPVACLEGQGLELQRCTEVLMHIHASPVLRLAGDC